MRTAPKAEDWCDSGQVDWKADPLTVLQEIDDQLVDHDLEIVVSDDANDQYEWIVRKRVVPALKLPDYIA